MQKNLGIRRKYNAGRMACCGILLGVLAVSMGGCSWFQPKEEKSARELAESGMEDLEKNNTKASIESFQKLKDWYPFSKYAILAELKLGDAYYKRKEYEEAIYAYEEFENLHPKNEAVPYVVYQIGRCYFDRLDTMDRDQTNATEAIRIYERLLSNYQDSPFAKKAKQHIRVCTKSLAGHDFYVGEFYFKAKHYKAALKRFEVVLKSYPDLGIHYRAIQYLITCRNKMGQDITRTD